MILVLFVSVENVKLYKAKVTKSQKTAVVQSADMSGQKTLKLHAQLTYKVKKVKKNPKPTQPLQHYKTNKTLLKEYKQTIKV